MSAGCNVFQVAFRGNLLTSYGWFTYQPLITVTQTSFGVKNPLTACKMVHTSAACHDSNPF